MAEYKYQIDNKRMVSLCQEDGVIQIRDQLDEIIYKDYIMMYADDYGFSAYSDNFAEVDELLFEIKPDNPLYYPFLIFLKGDNVVSFSSDFRKMEFDDISYIEVKNENGIIILKFVNKIPEEQNKIEKFDYEIKNIMFDLRSKLDSNNTDYKDRLHKFFLSAMSILKEEYHQISIDEYLYIKTRNLKK